MAQQANLAEGAGDRRTVLLGASYAEGWGSPALPGLDIVNRGRSGEETSQMLARFQSDVIAENPAIVIIWGHINDMFRAPNGDMAVATERAKQNFRTMIETAQAAGIRVIVGTEVTLREPRGVMNWLAALVGGLLGKESYQTRVNGYVREVNEFLRSLAAEQELTLLDIERGLSDESGRRRSEFTRDDGSHISDEGYDALTRFASAELRLAE